MCLIFIQNFSFSCFYLDKYLKSWSLSTCKNAWKFFFKDNHYLCPILTKLQSINMLCYYNCAVPNLIQIPQQISTRFTPTCAHVEHNRPMSGFSLLILQHSIWQSEAKIQSKHQKVWMSFSSCRVTNTRRGSGEWYKIWQNRTGNNKLKLDVLLDNTPYRMEKNHHRRFERL